MPRVSPVLLVLLAVLAVAPSATAFTTTTTPSPSVRRRTGSTTATSSPRPGHRRRVQIFRSTLRGTERSCLTCGLAGPNQVPVVQPRASFRPGGPPRRLTRSGNRGWVIPEFAWHPSGHRLLWTQARLRGRVDEPSVLRRIRDRIVGELSKVGGHGGVPVSIFDDVAQQVGEVLRDPSAFAPAGPPPRASDTRTVIGRLR